MKKFTKIALIVVGAVVVLIAAAALLIPRLVDPNQYKDKISALVAEQTGRDLTISGDITLSVFPWLGAEIGAVTLGNAPGFEADAFAAIRHVKVKVKLMPLLSKKVEADVVTVEGLVLNLEKDADGRTNWEDLAGASESSDGETEKTASEPPSAIALTVGGLDLQDARISWNDRQSGTQVTLKNLMLKTSAVNLTDPVSIETGFELDGGSLGLAGTVDAGLRAELDLAGGKYAAKDLAVTANLSGEAIPGGSAAVTLDGNAAFDAGAMAFDLEGIRVNATGLSLAPYTAEALVILNGAGDLSAGTVRIENLKATAALSNEAERAVAEVSATAEADLNAQRFQISGLTIEIPELSMKGLTGKIESREPGSATVDLSAGTVSLDTPALSGTLSGEAVPGGGAPVAFDLDATGDLNRMAFTVTPLTLTLADMTATANLDISMEESAPQINGRLAVAPFNLRDLLARLGIALPEMSDAKALSRAEISLALSATDKSAAVEGLKLRLDDTTLSGSLSVSDFEAPETRLDLALDRLQVERYLPPGEGEQTPRLLSDVTLAGEISAEAGFKIFRVARLALSGKLDKKLAFGLAAADVRADLDAEEASVEKLSIEAGEMALSAKAGVTGFKSAPAFTASIQSETFNLRKILSDMDLMPETADAGAMSAVKLSAALKGTPDAVSVSSLKLRLDDTSITGKADLTLAPAPAYAFNIAVDSIDADRYLPPPAPEAAGGKTAQAAAPAAEPTPLPVELLRSLALDGSLSVGKLKISKLSLSDIQFRVKADKGLLTLDPLAADLYGGSCGATIRLDAAGQTPGLTLAANLAGVQSGNLLKDLQGKKAILTGLANANLDLAATGADTGALVSSLGGTVSFTFTDGSVKGVDIAGKICNTLMAVDAGSLKADDLVGGVLQKLVQKATGTQAAATVEEADSTSFSELGGSMAFAKGVGTSEDLSMKSPMIRVQGAGSLDLPKQQLDYDATAYLVKSCQGQGGAGSADLKNLPIPVTISGPLADLKVRPNLTAGIVEVLARQQKKTGNTSAGTSTETSEQDTATEEVQEAAPESVEDAVTGILKGLLKK